MKKLFSSSDEASSALGTRGEFLEELRESFAESFAYDLFDWLSLPGSQSVTFNPPRFMAAAKEAARGQDETDDPVSQYTSNADIPIYLTGEVVTVGDPGSVSPQTAVSGPLVQVDDFRLDARFAGIDGSGYTIAVLDTGIDLDDPFFGPDLNNDGISDRIVYQYDFADNDGNAGDFDGHGSNVASIAASSDSTYTGMAPGANIAALKVFSDAGGSGDFGDVEAALQWVIANAEAYNIVSVNMSLGNFAAYDIPQQLFGISDEMATLAAMDVIVVSSSGNDFFPFNSVQGVSYPAADPNSLSVGAVYSADTGGWEYQSGAIAYSTGPDQITPFSQRDAELSDIFAPGAAITGAGAGEELVQVHGTSQAAPHIAGIVALVQELAVQEVGRKLSFDEIQALLDGTGDTIIDGDDEDDNVTNTGLAFQRVNVLALGEAILDLAAPVDGERDPTYFQVTALDKSQAEGDSGGTSYSFLITRSGDLSEGDSIDYSVAGSGGDPADAGDFLGGSLPGGSVFFGAGETSKLVTIQIAGDIEVEADETFELTINSVPPNGQVILPSDEATIENDDSAGGGPVVLLQADFDGSGDTGGFVYRDDLFGGNNGAYADGGWEDQGLTVTLGGINNSVITGMTGGWETSITLDEDMEVNLSFLYEMIMEEQYEADEYSQVLVSIDGGTPIVVDEMAGNGNGGPDETTGLQTFMASLGTLAAGDHTLAIGLYNSKKTWRDESSYLTIDDVTVTGTASAPAVATAATTFDSFFAIAADDAVKAEGDAGTTAYSFTVTRSGDTSGAASVDYSVTGSGINAGDFVGGTIPSGSLAFAAGETSKTLTIEVAGDIAIETDEGFGVVLSNPSAGAAITTAGAVGIILDDDDPAAAATSYAIAALDAVKAEGDAGLTDFTFTVTRSGDVSKAGLVSYEVTAGDTDAGDFAYGILPHGALFFAAGETSRTITVQVAGDVESEGSEDFAVALFDALGGADITAATANGTIVNDEPGTFYEISALDAVKAEGDLGPKAFTFTVARSGDTAVESSVDYGVYGTAGTADFLLGRLPSGTLNFAAGEASKTLTINIVGDTDFESDEVFNVTLSNPSLGSEIISGSAQGTILNDDPAPPASTFSIHTLVGSTNDEGDVGTTPFTFMVQRYGDTSSEQSVDYAVTGGVADFYDFPGGILPSGSVTFAVGETQKTITIDVAGDVTLESQETFTVSLSNPTGDAGISSSAGSANGTIRSDETIDTPSFAIQADSPFDAEGDSGSSAFTFTVTRNGDPTGTVSVDYQVSSSEADASDFAGGLLPAGTLIFVPGEISKTLTIDIAGDAAVESHEAFTVTLVNPSAGTGIARGLASTIIVNDDAVAPSAAAVEETTGDGAAATPDAEIQATATTYIGLNVAAPVEEGNESNSFYEVTVTRSGDTSATDLVDYVVRGIEADAADFPGGVFPSGTISFAPGEIKTILRIEIAGDTTLEMDETFQVDLFPQTPTTVFNYNYGTGTIVNDDPISASVALSIEVSSGWTPEGNSGLVEHKVEITRSGDLSEAGWVDYAVSGYGADPADPDDFVGGFLPQGRIYFLAGDESKTFSLYTVGDRTEEALEEFSVTIVDTSGDWFLLNNNAVGGIFNDDPPPLLNTLSIAPLDAVKAEGDAGATTFTFEITRGGAAEGTTTVHYQVYDKQFYGDVEANDFAGDILPAGTVVFADGETSKTVSVEVSGDTLFELFEDFVIRIYADEGDTRVLDSQAVGIIQNDDAAPGISSFAIAATDAVKAEGSSGTTPFTFEVTRSGDTTSSGSVDYRFSSSSQSLDATRDDFANLPTQAQTIYFDPGETSKTITLEVNGDTDGERDENFALELVNPSFNASITTATASATILNDDVWVPDSYFSIAATNAVKVEGNAGLNTFTFTVTRSGDTSSLEYVDYAVTGGPADAEDFYYEPSGTLAFSPGITSRTISISVAGDTQVENSEDFIVSLSNPSPDAGIDVASATGTILNDDGLPPGDTYFAIVANGTSKSEGNSGSTPFTFTVSRIGDVSAAGSIDYSVIGSDVDGSDFVGGTLPSGTLSFLANQTSKTLTIYVQGDSVAEYSEDFSVLLENPSSGSEILLGVANATIINDDIGGPPTSFLWIRATDPAHEEGDADTTTFTFGIERRGDYHPAGSVDYYVSARTADASDFPGGVLPSGTVFFAEGETFKTITIEVAGDTDFESNEEFGITLTNPSDGLDVALDSARGTIFNDDAPPPGESAVLLEADFNTGSGGMDGFNYFDGALGISGGSNYVHGNYTGEDLRIWLGGVDNNEVNGASGGWKNDFYVPEAMEVTLTFDYRMAQSGEMDTGEFTQLLFNIDGGPVQLVDQLDGDSGSSDNDFVDPTTYQVSLGVLEEGYHTLVLGGYLNHKDAINEESEIFFDNVVVTGDFPQPVATSFAIAAEDAVKAEGDAGSTAFTFTVTRSGDTSGAGSVDWAVSGAAVDGADFGGSLPSGTVGFAAGEVSKTITVNVAGDTDFEGDEVFTVTLSNPSAGSEITIATADGTILNDDPAPPSTFFALAAEDAVKAEGDASSTAFTFTVSRSGDFSGAGSVDWTVTSSEADGSDFLGGNLPSGTVSFAAGEASKTITVNVAGDTDFEADEDFTVTLSNPSAGSEITTPSAGGTILNDDPAPPSTFFALAAEDAVKAEGDAGTTAFTFTVTRSGDTSGADSVDYAVQAPTTALEAGADDFLGGVLPSGTVSFAAGETSKLITLQVVGDTDIEADELIWIRLSNPSAGAQIISVSAEGTILNDDSAPPPTVLAIAAEDAVKAEGDAGTTAYSFTVTRSGDTSGAESVDWAVSGSDVNSADFGGSLPGGTVNFAAGEVSKTVNVNVAGDTDFEADETFTVTLSNSSAGSAITTASAEGTILNDDTPPVGPVTVIDESFDSDSGSFTYADNSFGGSAGGDADGSWDSGALRVDLGGGSNTTVTDMSGGWTTSFTLDTESEVSLSFLYELTQSEQYEADEYSQLLVSIDGGAPILVDSLTGNGNGGGAQSTGPQTFSAVLGVLAAGDHSLTIGGFNNKKTWSDEFTDLTIDDVTATATPTAPPEPIDTSYAIAADNAVLSEGDAGTTIFTFTVTRSGDLVQNGSVDFTVVGSGGAAADADDFLGGLLPGGSIIFDTPGVSEATISIEVVGDTDFEADEGFTVILSNPAVGGEITGASAGGTILNDDPEPTGPVTLVEADFNAGGDTGGFVYSDGVFGGPASQSDADGNWSGGALTIDLGAGSNSTVTDMSGAWEIDFSLAADMDVYLTFSYELLISTQYEADEYSQVLVSIDGGAPITVDELFGDGNGGPDQTTGLQAAALDLGSLAAGDHSLAIGGYNSKKTWSDEYTEITIDDVLVIGTPPAGGSEAAPAGLVTGGGAEAQPLGLSETELLATTGF
ncbi:Calx-beta domain-containing protein [Pelagibius marinus]|uniref:Calx-beta domain-containing protein n=1 Tax=Pelagibius marinus TaxID=2762760 RepID=UPI0018726D73|nr:Calx-beta domain-containing protein [Pelagibius marinus]